MSILAVTETIPEFFSGRNIFITGGTGFIGKVLIEKLLRSCSDIGYIYLLMRPKKHKTIEERLVEMTNLPLYDRLKSEQPDAIKKIKLVHGDVKEINLGLSEEDEKLLIENVSIVYHAAASVRFDDPLKEAILMNTRGTREVVRLALKLKRLSVFLHVSTTYCNTDREEIGEMLYPPHADWKSSISMAEEVDRYTLDILTEKYKDNLPNTYTFTKSMAEHVINDLCKDKVPAIIFRPSIVISSVKEPVPGWIDNFNGPVGILVASGKGITRSVYSDPNIVSDYMPVDLAVKGIIIATWRKGTCRNLKEKLEVSFYNCSSHKIRAVTMGEMVHLGKQLTWDVPLNDQIWYPNGVITTSKTLHYIKVIFFHLLPAIVVDLLLRLANKKPMLFKLQRRIYIANMALEYFITRQWSFLNNNFFELENKLLPSDKINFSYEASEFDVYDYFKNALLGGRQYLLKEDSSTIEKARKHSKRMWIIAQVTNGSIYFLAIWFVFIKIDIVNVLLVKYNDFYENIFN